MPFSARACSGASAPSRRSRQAPLRRFRAEPAPGARARLHEHELRLLREVVRVYTTATSMAERASGSSGSGRLDPEEWQEQRHRAWEAAGWQDYTDGSKAWNWLTSSPELALDNQDWDKKMPAYIKRHADLHDRESWHFQTELDDLYKEILEVKDAKEQNQQLQAEVKVLREEAATLKAEVKVLREETVHLRGIVTSVMTRLTAQDDNEARAAAKKP